MASVGMTRRMCKQCGGPISDDMNANTIYCSARCSQRTHEEERNRKRRKAREVERADRTCPHCGDPVPLARNGRAIYCSLKCTIAFKNAQTALALRESLQDRICGYCDGPISDDKMAGTVYCSYECLREWQKEQMRGYPMEFNRVCLVCGDPFDRRQGVSVCFSCSGRVPITAAVKRAVRARDGKTCYLCGGECDEHAAWNHSDKLCFEHLVPHSRGGSRDIDNIAVAHHDCNRLKFVRLPSECIGMTFRGRTLTSLRPDGSFVRTRDRQRP